MMHKSNSFIDQCITKHEVGLQHLTTNTRMQGQTLVIENHLLLWPTTDLCAQLKRFIFNDAIFETIGQCWVS